MGKYDTCMKAYLQNKARFADLFNGSCFQGKQVIRAEDLEEASEGYVVVEEREQRSEKGAEEVHVDQRYGGQRRKHESHNHKKAEIFRDVKMRYRSGMILQILAVENQSYIDYGMPVRCMGYDAAEYGRQLKEKKQERRLFVKHREKQERSRNSIASETVLEQTDLPDEIEPGISTDEKLSGILKTDRLHPVYTICLYSGVEPWDGPRKLSDMMEFDPEEESVRLLFKDYPLTLFCVNEQEKFEEFHSDLKQLFRAMNCRKNKEKMAELMKDVSYSHLSKETWEAIAVMTDNAAMLEKKELYRSENGEEEEYNMCQALEELMEDKRNEGERIGEVKGEIRGEIKGIQKQQIFTIRQMIEGKFEVKDICRMVGCDAALVEEVRKNLL